MSEELLLSILQSEVAPQVPALIVPYDLIIALLYVMVIEAFITGVRALIPRKRR